MSTFEFVSHQYCPEDEYIKELVYLCFEKKYRVAYVRKKAANEGLFWSSPSISFKQDGRKEFVSAFMQDSLFLEKDIKKFLDDRSWDKEKKDIFSQEIPF